MVVHLVYRGVACRCGLPFLHAVASDVQDGHVVWCPGCETYELCEGAATELFWPPRTMYDGTEFHRKPPNGGVRYCGHVNREGSVTFAVDQATASTMSPYEASQMLESLQFLAFQSRARRAHLAGIDRFSFVCRDGAYFVRYMNQETPLARYQAGVRRASPRPRRCAACSAEIPTGTSAYRHGRNGSGDDRFCKACVEAPRTKPDARPVLRVIKGGRSKKT
jgi:hypothetical protein